MKVLLTGAFGNIGMSTLEELVQRGLRVRCFDLKTKANEKAAQKFEGRIETVWGDLRRPDDVAVAVQDQDVVVHTAAVIPRLSATGVRSEDRPDWARTINVGGTRNLISALKALPRLPKLVYTSSLHVYGRTQDQPPPRTVSDPVRPIEHYARHKVECERMIHESGLVWAILRLSAALPIRLILDSGVFEVPLGNRIEYVHSRDVGLAIANSLECEAVWGKTLLIGGGPKCRFYYRDFVARILNAIGVGMLPEKAFTTTPYSVDWLDTAESQRLLNYQRRTLDDYIRDVRQTLGSKLSLIKIFRPLARYLLLRQSPYLQPAREPVGA
jgi:nucleoside-diphosphate-sugar epimerase